MNRQLPLVLSLDISGRPISWIHWKHAICLVSRQQVAWSIGENNFTIMGGINRHTCQHSSVTLNSIIAIKGAHSRYKEHFTPHLTNRELFRRDRHLCLYCGHRYSVSQLTRDHVIPLGMGGHNHWENVVTACKPCNQRKSCRTPEMANMPLLALPYAPSMIEYLILANRRILADQMVFLQTHAPKKSKMFKYDCAT